MEFQKITLKSVMLNSDMIRKFNEKEVDKVNTPFLMILGGQDKIVDNKKSTNFFDMVKVQDKDVITYDDMDHLMFIDGEYLPFI